MNTLEYWLHYTNAPDRLIEWAVAADMLLAGMVAEIDGPPTPYATDVRAWLGTLDPMLYERVEHELLAFMGLVYERTAIKEESE